jgi:uncharacterized protein (TIGR04141 family)
MNTTRSNCWLAVPEIIDWSVTAGFRYSFRSNAAEYPDVNLDGFLESIKGAVSLPLLRARHVHRINNDGNEIGHWTIYRCVYCEVEQSGQTYIISAGRWYKIETDFVKLVNDFFSKISPYDGILSDYNDKSEGIYCSRLATAEPNRFALMDQKSIQIGGAYGKVEFCDLFSKDKDLIHIKRYGASSVLSHLFAQGTVSGEAFRADPLFRERVLEKLPASHRLFTKNGVPTLSEYRVVFAVISDKDGALSLPFFSRVNIRHACKRLDAFGYRTAIAKINVADEMRKRKKYSAK